MSSNRLFGLYSSTPGVSNRIQDRRAITGSDRSARGGSDYYIFATATSKDVQDALELVTPDSPFLMVRESTVSTIKPAASIRGQSFSPRASSISIERNVIKVGLRNERIKGSGVLSTNWEKVMSHLSERAILAGVFPSISSACRAEFGPDAELALELYVDPEIDDRYLTLYVRLRQYSADVLSRIERLNTRLEESLQYADGYLLIMTDFCNPGKTNAI